MNQPMRLPYQRVQCGLLGGVKFGYGRTPTSFRWLYPCDKASQESVKTCPFFPIVPTGAVCRVAEHVSTEDTETLCLLWSYSTRILEIARAITSC